MVENQRNLCVFQISITPFSNHLKSNSSEFPAFLLTIQTVGRYGQRVCHKRFHFGSHSHFHRFRLMLHIRRLVCFYFVISFFVFSYFLFLNPLQIRSQQLVLLLKKHYNNNRFWTLDFIQFYTWAYPLKVSPFADSTTSLWCLVNFENRHFRPS